MYVCVEPVNVIYTLYIYITNGTIVAFQKNNNNNKTTQPSFFNPVFYWKFNLEP